MSLSSTVGIAKLGTKSLRATVPEGIVEFLDIQAGDKLEWTMEIEKGKKIAKIKKAEATK
jgi:bifunctional DNA-binding transcriptional regulator/antitoxin component of YhaV-PrlF toxin-antitoxin module